jgi:hypothetical protein
MPAASRYRVYGGSLRSDFSLRSGEGQKYFRFFTKKSGFQSLSPGGGEEWNRGFYLRRIHLNLGLTQELSQTLITSCPTLRRTRTAKALPVPSFALASPQEKRVPAG